MARQREFDRDRVLEQAMRAFWRKGYEATSVQELVTVTGINRASMYDTFGDKRGLFLAAIDHYLAEVNGRRLAALAAPGSAKRAVRRYFEELLAFSSGEGRCLGCLLTNSAIELAPHDPEMGQKLRTTLSRVEARFREVIARGQRAGEISTDRDPQALARFLVSTVQGLRVLSRTDASEATLRDVVDVALAALD